MREKEGWKFWMSEEWNPRAIKRRMLVGTGQKTWFTKHFMIHSIYHPIHFLWMLLMADNPLISLISTIYRLIHSIEQTNQFIPFITKLNNQPTNQPTNQSTNLTISTFILCAVKTTVVLTACSFQSKLKITTTAHNNNNKLLLLLLFSTQRIINYRKKQIC